MSITHNTHGFTDLVSEQLQLSKLALTELAVSLKLQLFRLAHSAQRDPLGMVLEAVLLSCTTIPHVLLFDSHFK